MNTYDEAIETKRAIKRNPFLKGFLSLYIFCIIYY